MPNVTIGDLLKSEADRLSRVAITAPVGTKIGQPVLFEPRGQYLIALSDEVNGEVLAQPHNCVIYLNSVDPDAVAATLLTVVDPEGVDGATIEVPLDASTLKTQGDTYGIKYIGELPAVTVTV